MTLHCQPIAVYEKYKTTDRLYTAIKKCRVSQVLTKFGMADDIESSLTGARIDPYVLKSMANVLPLLKWINEDPWFQSK